MPLVSIIVPIYNKAAFLERGVKSLLAQELSDIQVILVNDGSTDDSLEICNRYAQSDQRIVVIDQPNGGVSRARNSGLSVAEGEYVAFMDPDDWAEANMYCSMVELCRMTDSALCLCDFYHDRDGLMIPIRIDSDQTLLEGKELHQKLTLNMIAWDPELPYRKEIKGSVCRILVKREYLQRIDLQFEPGLVYMEDLLFTVGLLCHTDRVCLDSGIWYHYMVHDDSASKSYIPGMYEHLLGVSERLDEILQKAGFSDQDRQRLDYRMVFNGLRAIINEANPQNPHVLRDRLKEIRRILDHPTLQTCIRTLDFRFSPPARRRAIQWMQESKILRLYLYFRFKSHPLDPKSPPNNR